MPDIYHTLFVQRPIAEVFRAISTPGGLDRWWTRSSEGIPALGSPYKLFFEPAYDWKAVVTICEPQSAFELQITKSNVEWEGTRVGFVLQSLEPGETELAFYHRDWPAITAEFCASSYCWAMYLRILRRSVQFKEEVLYENRLDA